MSLTIDIDINNVKVNLTKVEEFYQEMHKLDEHENTSLVLTGDQLTDIFLKGKDTDNFMDYDLHYIHENNDMKFVFALQEIMKEGTIEVSFKQFGIDDNNEWKFVIEPSKIKYLVKKWEGKRFPRNAEEIAKFRFELE